MSDETAVGMLPISSLGALEYCPRSFYYQVVQGEMEVNEAVLEGQLAHQRVHQPGIGTTEEGETAITQLYLASETLRLSGFADVVEERAGVFLPVEYKSGQQGDWPGNHLQLCAQALCLEERQPDKAPLAYGYISYLGSRRRVKVPFTAALRARTKAAIARAFQIAVRQTPPPPLSGKLAARCPSCSLLPLCLPEEVRQLRGQKDE